MHVKSSVTRNWNSLKGLEELGGMTLLKKVLSLGLDFKASKAHASPSLSLFSDQDITWYGKSFCLGVAFTG